MPGTILIADDHESSRAGLEALLSLEGYNVLTAEDGIEALAGCGKSLNRDDSPPQGLKPSLILHDLRGAKAPLYHSAAGFRDFFRSLLEVQNSPLPRFGTQCATEGRCSTIVWTARIRSVEPCEPSLELPYSLPSSCRQQPHAVESWPRFHRRTGRSCKNTRRSGKSPFPRAASLPTWQGNLRPKPRSCPSATWKTPPGCPPGPGSICANSTPTCRPPAPTNIRERQTAYYSVCSTTPTTSRCLPSSPKTRPSPQNGVVLILKQEQFSCCVSWRFVYKHPISSFAEQARTREAVCGFARCCSLCLV